MDNGPLFQLAKGEKTIKSQAVLPPNEVRIEIAEMCVALRCDNGRFVEQVKKRYEGFLSKKAPVVTVDVLISDMVQGSTSEGLRVYRDDNRVSLVLRQTRGYIDTKNSIGRLEMTPPVGLESLDALEIFLRALYSLLCIRNSGFLLHAAGIAKDSKGYLFLGHSGSGKTTVSRLSANYKILADDLLVVRATDDVWKVFGTPFGAGGDIQKRANESVEIRAFFGLAKDEKVFLERLEYPRAVAELISSTPMVHQDPTLSEDVIGLCSDIARKIPGYRMHFLLDNSFWRYIDELA